MILILGIKLKHLNQENYDSLICNLKNNWDSFVESVFGHDENVIFYGTYIRFFASEIYPCRFPLRIQRVLSLDSGKSHAIIPSCLVPYSQTPLEIQVEIIEALQSNLFDLSVLYDLDPGTLRHIRSLFTTYWKSCHDWFLDPIDTLVTKAFHLKHKQFMQTRGFTFLYPPT